ncbi:MAG: chemotaxis protein CheX [Methanomicrobium sp.]|nr:chemotaxis protein CheX [Methanomicrobium sp.]MDD4299242.1 chemotaxis protein CheX [Methanomicrobium sp.]
MQEVLNGEDADAVKELLNIGIGRSAAMLNTITKSHIALSIPEVRVYNAKTLKKGAVKVFDENSATVRLEFKGDFSGITVISFPKDSAAKLVMAITGEEAGTPELDSIRIEALKEIGNIIINGVMGSIGNVLKTRLDYSIPAYEEGSLIDLIRSGEGTFDEHILMATASFNIKDLNVEGNIFMVLELGSMQVLLRDLRSC